MSFIRKDRYTPFIELACTKLCVKDETGKINILVTRGPTTIATSSITQYQSTLLHLYLYCLNFVPCSINDIIAHPFTAHPTSSSSKFSPLYVKVKNPPPPPIPPIN